MAQSAQADGQSLLMEEQSDIEAPEMMRGRAGPVKIGVFGLSLLAVAAFWSTREKSPAMRSHMRDMIERDGTKDVVDGMPMRAIAVSPEPGEDLDQKVKHIWTLKFKSSYNHYTQDQRKEKAREIFGGSVIWVGKVVPQIEVQGTREEVEAKVRGHTEYFAFAEEENHQMRATPELPSDENVADHDRRLAAQQDPPSWGTDRSDQRSAKLSNSYEAAQECKQGEGTHIYIFDTGIRTSHVDFGGRAINTLEVLRHGSPTVCNGDTTCASDAQGHGTHCAGSAGGTSYGLAKKATIHSVKILGDDGSGSFDWFNVALDWVVANGQSPAVVSASLGGKGRVESTEDAITTAVSNGVVVVVAAGNENDNACRYSPAFTPAAITVGSTRETDRRSVFSNYGNCVDIFAPGTDITSASSSADRAAATYSGTSMACPHVAGAVALLRAADQSASSSQITAKLLHRATHGMVRDGGEGSPGSLLYVGPGDDDSQVTHVPTDAPGPNECSVTGWKVMSGSCEIDEDCCLTSPNYASGEYGNDEECHIQVGSSPGYISQEHFSTEAGYDLLHVPTTDGETEAYHGDTGPHDIFPQATGVITWSSDANVINTGFKLCLRERNQCPENGWLAPPVCAPRWTYKDEIVHGCTERDHNGGWCMHDDGTGDPYYLHWFDEWTNCERCN